MLRYEIEGNNVITVDLQNRFTIMAIAKWHNDKKNYTIRLFIKENMTNVLDVVDDGKEIEMEGNFKTINNNMAKYITDMLENDKFTYSINRYKYMMKCFDKGDEFYEKEPIE